MPITALFFITILQIIFEMYPTGILYLGEGIVIRNIQTVSQNPRTLTKSLSKRALNLHSLLLVRYEAIELPTTTFLPSSPSACSFSHYKTGSSIPFLVAKQLIFEDVILFFLLFKESTKLIPPDITINFKQLYKNPQDSELVFHQTGSFSPSLRIKAAHSTSFHH
jgi:hypothetical protein